MGSSEVEEIENYYVADYYDTCTKMESVPDSARAKQVSLTMPDDEYYFRIFVNQDARKAIYPELNGTYVSGLTSAMGPDSIDSESFWVIQAQKDANVTITYD